METDMARRCIGLDVHREFAQVAIWQDGLVRQAGRFATTPEGVRASPTSWGRRMRWRWRRREHVGDRDAAG